MGLRVEAIPPTFGNQQDRFPRIGLHLLVKGGKSASPGLWVAAAGSLLIRGILAALRQKLHLSTCPNLASHLSGRRGAAGQYGPWQVCPVP
jgi:hypothetical protein